MSDLTTIISGTLIISGACSVFIGMLGVYRMPDIFTRLHASSIIDTMGTIFILVGLMIYSGLNMVSLKLMLIMFFILITTPAAAHALAKAASHGSLKAVLDKDQ